MKRPGVFVACTIFAMIAIIILIVFGAGCTENQRAKSWGGEYEEEIPCGTKVITTTWKGSDFWILYRSMREDEEPEKYIFQESSKWGSMEGTVRIKEWRCPK